MSRFAVAPTQNSAFGLLLSSFERISKRSAGDGDLGGVSGDESRDCSGEDSGENLRCDSTADSVADWSLDPSVDVGIVVYRRFLRPVRCRLKRRFKSQL